MQPTGSSQLKLSEGAEESKDCALKEAVTLFSLFLTFNDSELIGHETASASDTVSLSEVRRAVIRHFVRNSERVLPEYKSRECSLRLTLLVQKGRGMILSYVGPLINETAGAG
jgi:hypothetical protein